MTAPNSTPPICRPPTYDTLDILREATNLGPEATMTPPAAADHTAVHAAESGIHVGSEVVLQLTEGAGAGTAGGAAWLGAAITAPLAAGVFGVLMIEEAYAEGERRDLAYQSDVLRGALAKLEGRGDTPEARAEAARCPGYRDGMERVERMANGARAARLPELARMIRCNVREGNDAVLRGEDRGECFEMRYRMDPAFRHGVDHARHLRESDPEQFAAQQRRQEEMDGDVLRGRIGALRP